MDKTLVFSIVGIILLIIIIFLFMKNRNRKDDNSMEEFIITEEDNKSSQKKEPEINITAVDFKVVGNKDKYTIQEKMLFIIVTSMTISIFAPFSVVFFLILAGTLILLDPIG